MSYIIALACVVVFALGNPQSQSLWLWPVGESNHHAWQWITYGFSHGGWLHLVFNIIALISFGPTLEREWGHLKFTLAYTVTLVVAGLVQSAITNAPLVGASGALFGLFAAYTLAKPHARIVSPLLFPMAAWKVLALYALLSTLALVFHWLPGLAHAAHLSGMALGCVWNLAFNFKDDSTHIERKRD